MKPPRTRRSSPTSRTRPPRQRRRRRRRRTTRPRGRPPTSPGSRSMRPSPAPRTPMSWRNYVPRVYPTYLRGTGESFAANIGGRMLGTSGQFLAALLAPVMLTYRPGLGNFGKIAWASEAVAFFVYALGSILTFFLPQPKEE